MGNMIFILLTGLWPYYDIPSEREEELQELAIAGELPYINPAYQQRSLIEGRLVELMNLCHQRNPEDRIDIFEVVQHLYQTRQMHEENQKQTKNQL